ncbi:MAG TPA: FUSC family protein [Candidatus Cybelea sp.]|nr:FUSC family protein [Candidatus Cybelea sp.]
MLNWLRDLARTAVTFDRSALEPGYALRCTAGVAIPLLVAAAAGRPALGVPAAIGAFITGFTSLQGIYRTRLAAILAAALGMAATSFVGSVAGHSTTGIVLATAIAGYACATVGQIGPAAATVALNSVIAFVLFSSQPLAPVAASLDSALVFAGGLIQAALLLLAWPAERGAAERGALAAVYRDLAAYARQIADRSPVIPPITPFATARQVLADPQPFARSAELARFNRLLEDSEVIRRRLGALAALPDHARSYSAKAANAIAAHLDATADVLTGAKDDTVALDQSEFDDVLAPAGLADLAAHARDAAEAATMLATGRLPRFSLVSKVRPAPYVRDRIDWLSRDSFRFAIVLAAAMVAGRYFAADRGYWIPLTAAIVLKPDFQTTFLRGFARIGGTLVGAVIASLVMIVARGHPAIELGGIIAAAAAAYVTFNPNYALFTVAITSFVVLVLGMRGLPGTTTVDARLLDTLAGGALAMVGYLVFPSWEYKRTRALLADLLDAQRGLADAILRAYADPSSDARAIIDERRNDVWRIRTTVEASIDRSRGEPQRAHSIGTGRALRILAATQRFGLASLALETALETRQSPAPAGLEIFTDSLGTEMRELAAALREARRARLAEPPPAVLAAADNHGLRAFADATARIARLVGVQKR